MRNKQWGFCDPSLSQLIFAVVVVVAGSWGAIEGLRYVARHLAIGWLP